MITNCRDAAPLVEAWVDGALEGEPARAFEAHLAGCASCRVAVHEARDLLVVLHGLSTPPCPPDIETAALDRARPTRRRRSSPWRPAAAALAAGVAALALLVFSDPATGPTDEEIARAEREARLALAIVARVTRDAAEAARTDVFDRHVVGPLTRPLPTGGEAL